MIDDENMLTEKISKGTLGEYSAATEEIRFFRQVKGMISDSLSIFKFLIAEFFKFVL